MLAGAMLVITSPASGTKVYSSGEEMNHRLGAFCKFGELRFLVRIPGRHACVHHCNRSRILRVLQLDDPWSLPVLRNYRIKIVSSDDTSIHDFSDQFTVVHMPTTLSVTVPSGSVNWSTGGTYSIDWSYSEIPFLCES